MNEHAPRKSRRPAAARDRQNVRQRAECTGVHTSGTPCLLRHVGCLYSRGTCTNGMGTNAPKGAAECDDKYIRHRRPECGERVAGCEHNGNNTPLWEQHRDCRTSFWRGWHNERKAGKIVASARRDLPDDRITTTRCQRSGRALRQRLLASIVQDNLCHMKTAHTKPVVSFRGT